MEGLNALLLALAGLVKQIALHLETVFEVGSGALCIAVIHTWPARIPSRLQDWWTWAREALQTAIPAARAAGPNPTLPAATPDPTR